MTDERYIVTDAVTCSACKAPLWKLQDKWYPAVEPELMPNTLELELHGGYGMFFDTTPPNLHVTNIHGDHRLTLCHDCAHKLVGSSPFLTRLLKGGHFHGFTTDVMDPLCESVSDFHKDWGNLS